MTLRYDDDGLAAVMRAASQVLTGQQPHSEEEKAARIFRTSVDLTYGTDAQADALPAMYGPYDSQLIALVEGRMTVAEARIALGLGGARPSLPARALRPLRMPRGLHCGPFA